MHELLGLSGEEITAIGSGFGLFLLGLFSAFRGYKARPREPVVRVPKAAIPHELQEQIDDIENRCAHIERKTDQMASRITLIYNRHAGHPSADAEA